MNFNKIKIVPIKGDASFRKFYRKRNKGKSTIIVYANKEKEKNLLIYDAINKLLIKHKITAPKLINQNYKKNYIEIEDFGNTSIFNKLKKTKIKQIHLFKKVISLLIKIQKIKQKQTETFSKKKYKIKNYSKKKLLIEANLFIQWYIPKVIQKKNRKILTKTLKVIFIKLLSKLKNTNSTFVHRDFHVSNLMEYKNKIAVLDSQDALYGNIAYDPASLIDDVRYKTSKRLKEKIYNQFVKSKKINLINFNLFHLILSS